MPPRVAVSTVEPVGKFLPLTVYDWTFTLATYVAVGVAAVVVSKGHVVAQFTVPVPRTSLVLV